MRDLTIKERILLHLFDYTHHAEDYEAPFEVTQSGIAKAARIRVQHATQYVKPLVAEELVEEDTRHVQRQARRRKAYFLTPSGRHRVASMRSALLNEEVPFGEGSGQVAQVPLSRVYQQERRGTHLLELLHELETTGHISAVFEVPVAGVVDQTSEAPPVERVHGREEELRNVLQSVGRFPLIVVTGMAGIGKTTLGAKVCDELRGQRPLVWRRIRQWDSSTSLAQRIAAFLEQAGRTALQSYLKASRAPEFAQVEEILLNQLVGVNALFIFDDVHVAAEDAASFLSLLFGVLSQVEGSTVLLLSRTTPGFYSRRAVSMEENVLETALPALDPVGGRAILADAGIPEDQQEALYGLSGGSPLFLKLLAKTGALSETERRWETLDAYISEEIESALDEPERSCLQVASLYELPVPPEGLLLEKRGDLGTLLGLRRKGLLEEMDGNRLALHDSLREYFRRGLPTKRRETLVESVSTWLRNEAQTAESASRAEAAISYLENALLLDAEPTRRGLTFEKLGDLRTAIENETAALDAYREAFELAAEGEDQARLHSKLALRYNWLLLPEEAEREVKAGLAIAGEAPSIDAARLLYARAVIKEHHYQDYRGAMEDVEKALDRLPTFPENLEFRADLEVLKGVIHWVDSENPDLLATRWSFEAALKDYEALGNRAMVAFCHRGIAFIHLERGEIEEASESIERGAALAEETGEYYTLIAKAWFVAECLGRNDEAEEIYNRSFELLRKSDVPESLVWQFRLLSDLYRRQGRYEESRETLGYFLEASGGIINLYRRVENLALMARLCLRCGDVDEAERWLEEAESQRGATASKWLDWNLGWARGMVHAARGEVAEAEITFSTTMEPAAPEGRKAHVLEYLTTLVEQGEALLDYGSVLATWGEKKRAKEILALARKELKARGRRPLEEKALAALLSLEPD